MHLSLRLKIAVTLVGLVLLLGIAATIHARQNLFSKLERSLEYTGTALAVDLAANGTNAMLTEDTFGLYEMINAAYLSNGDVRYIFVVDAQGEVRAHTFEGGIPLGLRRSNVPQDSNDLNVARIDTDEGKIIDIAALSLGGSAGIVHVGMSERRIRAEVNDYVRELLILVAVVVGAGILASYVLASFLTRPVTRLVEAVRLAGRGNLGVRVPEGGSDEIGQLSRAFNVMATEVARSQDELVRRNEELTLLNAIADILNRPQHLRSFLDDALDRLLQAGSVRAAWIFTCDGDRSADLTLASYRGEGNPGVADGQRQCLGEGPCREALVQGEPVVVSDPSRCPLLASVGRDEDAATVHASLPLRSTTGVLGILNVVPNKGSAFSQDDLRFLGAVAQHIATAVENQRLYEELQRKEEIRGRLLQQVISAQEDERKRIARELHDELAQRLTGLTMSLGMIQSEAGSNVGREFKRRVKYGLAVASDALDETRKLILDLRPSLLDDMGLVASIQWYAEERLKKAGVRVLFQVQGDARRLTPAVETAFFRIMQEGMNNVVRHAQADKASVAIAFGCDLVVGTVKDNGTGFDVAATLSSPDEQAALGIIGMQERASLLGGHLEIAAERGSGTVLTVTLPAPTESREG